MFFAVSQKGTAWSRTALSWPCLPCHWQRPASHSVLPSPSNVPHAKTHGLWMKYCMYKSNNLWPAFLDPSSVMLLVPSITGCLGASTEPPWPSSGKDRAKSPAVRHTHTPSPQLPRFPGGLTRISELFGVSSREWWGTGTAAAANGLPHRRNRMFILWLAEAGCAVANILGWAGAQQCWSGWGRARWRGNYRPCCFLALLVRIFFSGGGKAVFTASLEPGHHLFSERACCLPLNCTV